MAALIGLFAGALDRLPALAGLGRRVWRHRRLLRRRPSFRHGARRPLASGSPVAAGAIRSGHRGRQAARTPASTEAALADACRGARAARGDARASGRARGGTGGLRAPARTRARPGAGTRATDRVPDRAGADRGARVPSLRGAGAVVASGRDRRFARTPPATRANPLWSVVHRRQRADAHRRRRRCSSASRSCSSTSPSTSRCSIELRLAAVAGFGVALIALGLRLAAARPGYGLSLQGAGAGVLYLTTYAAFRLYGVLPEAPAIVAARRRGGAHDRSRGARRLAAARRPRDRRRLPRARAGRQRRRSAAAVRLLCRAERRDLRARVVEVLARPQRRGLRLHVRAGLRRGVTSSTMPRTTRSCSRSWRSSSSSTWRSRSSTCGARRSTSRTRSTACWSSASRSAGFALQAALVHEFHHGVAWSAVAIAVVLCRSLPGDAQARGAGLRAPFPRVSRAGRHLRDDRDSVRVRRPLHRRDAGRSRPPACTGSACGRTRASRGRSRSLVEVGAGIAFVLVGRPGRRRHAVRQCAFRRRDADRRLRPRDGVRRRSRGERPRAPANARCVAAGVRLGRALVARRRRHRARATSAARRRSRTPCSPG